MEPTLALRNEDGPAAAGERGGEAPQAGLWITCGRNVKYSEIYAQKIARLRKFFIAPEQKQVFHSLRHAKAWKVPPKAGIRCAASVAVDADEAEPSSDDVRSRNRRCPRRRDGDPSGDSKRRADGGASRADRRPERIATGFARKRFAGQRTVRNVAASVRPFRAKRILLGGNAEIRNGRAGPDGAPAAPGPADRRTTACPGSRLGRRR